jgi:hypothetical protein
VLLLLLIVAVIVATVVFACIDAPNAALPPREEW